MVKNIVTLMSFLAITTAIVPAVEAMKRKTPETPEHKNRPNPSTPLTPVKEDYAGDEKGNFRISNMGKKTINKALSRNKNAKTHGATLNRRFDEYIEAQNQDFENDTSATE